MDPSQEALPSGRRGAQARKINVTFATIVALAFAYEASLAVFFEDTPTIR